MARNAARLKMGYYPLPKSEATRLRQLLEFASPASVVDPCLGQGTALEIITKGAGVRRYGVELDAGEFASSAGAEVFATNQNFNYSRSLLFAWAIPLNPGILPSSPVEAPSCIITCLIMAKRLSRSATSDSLRPQPRPTRAKRPMS